MRGRGTHEHAGGVGAGGARGQAVSQASAQQRGGGAHATHDARVEHGEVGRRLRELTQVERRLVRGREGGEAWLVSEGGVVNDDWFECHLNRHLRTPQPGAVWRLMDDWRSSIHRIQLHRAADGDSILMRTRRRDVLLALRPYCDQKVANREIRVRHFVIENGP
jgi:hypothetical protein